MENKMMRRNLLFSTIVLLSSIHEAMSGDFVCNEAQIEEQSNQFFAKYKEKVASWSSCGGKKWLTLFHELAPAGDRNIMDIGCNKGYESGLFFDLLCPELQLNANSMFKVHLESHPGLEGGLCGACSNCQETAVRGSVPDTTKHSSVNVYCFEPSIRNFGALLSVEKRYRESFRKHHANWLLYNAAVSNITGVTSFPRNCGSTLCSLHANTAHSTLDVTLTITVDDFMAQAQLAKLDILKIDTEGNDPAVLQGAQNLIKDQQVDLLYFEYHGLGLWKTTSLKSLVEWFDEFGYVCYLEGSPTLTRLTGCWTDRYELKSWSNVVCTHSSSYLYKGMESFTFLATEHASGHVHADHKLRSVRATR